MSTPVKRDQDTKHYPPGAHSASSMIMNYVSFHWLYPMSNILQSSGILSISTIKWHILHNTIQDFVFITCNGYISIYSHYGYMKRLLETCILVSGWWCRQHLTCDITSQMILSYCHISSYQRDHFLKLKK